MKKKILSLSVIVICLAILASGTFAYFSNTYFTHNVITSGSIDVQIIESAKNADGTLVDFPEEGLKGMLPGSTASKIVSVRNVGEFGAWFRVRIDQVITAWDGTPLPVVLPGGIPVMSYEVNSSKWLYHEGWYYYTDPMEPGQTTDVLLEEVFFAWETGDEYQNCTANLIITAQAVQTVYNGDSVLDAQGWPEEVPER